MVRGDGIIYLAHERGQKDGSDQHDQAGSQSRVQVVVRVRPVLPEENAGDVAVVCTPDGSKVQVGALACTRSPMLASPCSPPRQQPG
jgi:hypothetical protein